MEYPRERNLWVDYLRSAITVLVVAHHSSLSYTTFARFNKEAYIFSTHPIVDSSRWVGLDVFENFNDVFFMSLMFLIGGLFLMKSIGKKGRQAFIRDRFYRLFIPFLFPGTFFMLIAYFPAYWVAHGSAGIGAYLVDFFTTEYWPVGPPWFIWVLFLFNLLFALFYNSFQKAGKWTGKPIPGLKDRPFAFFAILFWFTWLLYVPIAYLVGAGKWTGLGPFDFQVSRLLLYFGYFTLGILIGNTAFSEEVFSTESRLVRKWWLWVGLALFVYAVLTLVSGPLSRMVADRQLPEFAAWMMYYVLYTASCVLSCIAFITTFRRWVHSVKDWWNSLSDNAYLIYLVHYIFVVWCQFGLLNLNIPAFLKFLITFVVALSLSWMASILLRRISLFRRYL